MSAQPLKGFPLPDDYATTRVPNAVLGRVLSSVDDADVIKLIMRAVWLLERQNGYPRFIASEQLRSDRVLSMVLSDAEVFESALEDAVGFGVLAKVSINGVERLMLNTESAHRASLGSSAYGLVQDAGDDADGWDAPAVESRPANAFRAYEGNIGVLSPMIREGILTALEDFSDDEITQAIKIAVENESRSWSFVAGVLRRWMKEGVPDDHRIRWTSRQSQQRREPETRPINGTRRTPNRANQPRVPETELEEFLEYQRGRRAKEQRQTIAD